MNIRDRKNTGRRGLGMTIAGAALVAAFVGATATSALAWGNVTVGAPAGCTGSAFGSSWVAGPTAHAETRESGNLCLAIYPVSAGLRQDGSSTMWNGQSGINYAHASSSQIAYSYEGGWHRWGAKVAS